MVRPKKLTLDFYIHDADASSDPKIIALTRRYGNDGWATYFRLLETLCSQEDIRLSVNESWQQEVQAALLNLRDTTHFIQIVDYCITVGLFNKQLWESERIIFSDALYQRYVGRLEERMQSAQRMKRKRESDSLRTRLEQLGCSPSNSIVTRNNPPDPDLDPDPDPNTHTQEVCVSEIENQLESQARMFHPGGSVPLPQGRTDPDHSSLKPLATPSFETGALLSETQTLHSDQDSAPENKIKRVVIPQDPEGGFQGRAFNGLKGTHRSCSSDPWMVSNSNVKPDFRDWVAQRHKKLGLKACTNADVSAEIRNDYARASDLWQEYQESSQPSQTTTPVAQSTPYSLLLEEARAEEIAAVHERTRLAKECGGRIPPIKSETDAKKKMCGDALEAYAMALLRSRSTTPQESN